MPSSPAEAVIALYQTHAESWIRLRGTRLRERRWLEDFLALLPGRPGRVLDIGCGAGQPIAGHLIARGHRVIGIDAAGALIERARLSFPDQRWITADMRALPPLGRFDGLIAWHSLFHLCPEDQRKMFATFRGLASPGAALMFTSGTAHGEAIGRFEGHPLYHGSLDTAEYRKLLCGHGFDIIRHTESDPDCGGATIWLARRSGPATSALLRGTG